MLNANLIVFINLKIDTQIIIYISDQIYYQLTHLKSKFLWHISYIYGTYTHFLNVRSYTPVLMKSVNTLLTLEAQISRLNGTPISYNVQIGHSHKLMLVGGQTLVFHWKQIWLHIVEWSVK